MILVIIAAFIFYCHNNNYYFGYSRPVAVIFILSLSDVDSMINGVLAVVVVVVVVVVGAVIVAVIVAFHSYSSSSSDGHYCCNLWLLRFVLFSYSLLYFLYFVVFN